MSSGHPIPSRAATWASGYFTGCVEAGFYARDGHLATLIRKHGKEEGIRRAAEEHAELAEQMRKVTEFFNAERRREP